MSNKTYCCPECGSEKLFVYLQDCYVLNKMEFYYHSSKTHDHDVDCRCGECCWNGVRSELKESQQ